MCLREPPTAFPLSEGGRIACCVPIRMHCTLLPIRRVALRGGGSLVLQQKAADFSFLFLELKMRMNVANARTCGERTDAFQRRLFTALTRRK